jgi:hypothetical protein
MELTLHPLAKTCRVTGTAFAEGDRVVSYLVREAGGEFGRHDMLAAAEADYAKPEVVFCRWVVEFKARRTEENSGRALKLTAENLFVTLADPMMESSDANTPMLQFLALMLERKKVLKPRGLNADRTRNVYEHAKTKQLFEVPVGELDEAFFVNIQGQLDLLVGSPKSAKKDETKPADATPATGDVAATPPETTPAEPAGAVEPATTPAPAATDSPPVG